MAIFPGGFLPNIFVETILALAVVIIFLHRYLLPKPIPGIPYNARSARRILGDLPDVLNSRKETGEMWSFVKQCALDLHSPIFQLFMSGPFGRPWVVVTDFRESQDIQSSRQGEFDRSAWLGEVFGPLLPRNHVWMESNDQFRANRSLLRDTMSPIFLNNVAAPAIHSAILDLVQIRREKKRLAQGRPFQADRDIMRGVVDGIFLAAMGVEMGLNKAQAQLLSGLDKIHLEPDRDSPAVFPLKREPQAYTAIRKLVDSIQIGMNSPFPRLTMKFVLKFLPSVVAAREYTESIIAEILKESWTRVSKPNGGSDALDEAKCAADVMVRRGAHLAEKQGLMFRYDAREIHDELLGFYLAGHETTSTTICWAVKRLTEHQDVQQKLRSALRTAHPEAADTGRVPTAREIVETAVPYLEAFIEENHRLGTAIPTVIRRATRDAVILGHIIPKGTDVFMLVNGPSFQSPALPVDEAMRSKTSREARHRYGNWKDTDVEQFIPERFLMEGEDGESRFDAFAGPVLPYGAGLRGCFGVRLGMLELRIMITLIVWSSELQRTPQELSSFRGNDVNTHRAQQTYLRLV